MSFGGWSINKSTYDFIRSILSDNKTILELGSGEGTAELAKHYKMYSIEANPQWVGKYDSTYIYAPIKMYTLEYTAPDIPGNIGWHDPEILSNELPLIDYDLLLVDGPEGCYGRGGFFKHLNLFNINMPIVFDDINRPHEYALMNSVSKKLNRKYIILNDRVTGFMI